MILSSGKSQWSKWWVLMGLYVAQSVPMSFFSTVVPVIMRQEEYSLQAIGMLQLIKLPWILKLFWAPLVDRTAITPRHLVRWILLSELFYAVAILSIAFLHLEVHFPLIVLLMVLAIAASATQDIATDAFAIRQMTYEQRGTGNSIQSAGGFIGALLGSGLLLILYRYWGWTLLLAALAGFVLLAVLPLWFYRPEPEKTPTEPVRTITFADLGLFFARKGIYRHVLLLFFFYSGLMGTLTMLKPFLVDAGYSVENIGVMNGLFGTSVAALAAFASGRLVRKMGRLRSLYVISSLMVLTALYFVGVSYVAPVAALLYPGIALLWGAYGAANVIIYTLSMDKVRPGREGTDFTLQIVLTQLSALLMAVFSGFLAEAFTYRGLFIAELALATAVLLSIPLLYKKDLSAV